MSPLLSLIVGGRNDSYMGDFKWRFSTMLNYLGQSAAQVGVADRLECVVCDWGSEEPLHEVLQLTPEASAITRFVHVPKEVADRESRGADFPIPIVQNVAIRRSHGTYIGQTDSDVLYTPATLLSLFAALDGRIPDFPTHAFLHAGRRHLPFAQVERQPGLAELTGYVARNAALFPSEPQQAGSGAPTSLVLLHRDIWHACNGYDERFVHWGWMDLDLALRVTQRYPIFALNNIGTNLIHLEHYPKERDYDPSKHFRATNRPDDNPGFSANDAGWGLAGATFAEHRGVLFTNVHERSRTVHEQYIPGTVDVSPILSQFPATISDDERKALELVAHYAHAMKPQTYLETGVRLPYGPAIVAASCPGVEMTLVTDWERGREDEGLFDGRTDSCFTFWAANTLRNVGQWANVRFMGGGSCVFEPFDLAFIRAGGWNLLWTATNLRPRGLVAWVAESDAVAERVEEARLYFPNYTHIRLSDRAGAMIAATPPIESRL